MYLSYRPLPIRTVSRDGIHDCEIGYGVYNFYKKNDFYKKRGTTFNKLYEPRIKSGLHILVFQHRSRTMSRGIGNVTGSLTRGIDNVTQGSLTLILMVYLLPLWVEMVGLQTVTTHA